MPVIYLRKYVAMVLLVCCIASVKAQAQESAFKSFSVKVNGGYSVTNETSKIQTVGGRYKLNNSPVAGFGVAWFLTPSWSAEISASAGRYGIFLSGGDYSSMQVLRDEISIGKVWIIPVSLSVRYHVTRWEKLKPYVAAGRTFLLFNYPDPGWGADAVEYHSRAALHAGIGADYHIGNNWFINGELRHHFTNRSDVTPDFTNSVGWKLNGQLKPDPAQVSIGIGYRF